MSHHANIKTAAKINFKYFVSGQRIKCAKILQNGDFMRDYDKERVDKPLIVENNWFLRAEITGMISCIIFFVLALLILIYSSPEDATREFSRRTGITIACSGILYVIFGHLKFLRSLTKNKTYSKIYDDRIEYEFIDYQGNKDLLTAPLSGSKIITHAYIPIFGTFHPENRDSVDKMFYPLNFILNSIRSLIFYTLSLFKIRKYLIFRFDDLFICVESNPSINERFKSVGFNKDTLVCSLISHNTKIFDKEIEDV